MTAYYNEIDRFCCDWLSNLMDAEMITPGKIDDRSIVDVRPDDLAGFERVHFFAGIGGWDHSLNLAGWSGRAWTGSCPCQPFSLAGAQKGFSDERHLWPEFRRLIAECNPPVVFGEQVASASDWLGLVRGDLEALGYAVGAIPVQAASAGADHLRDRYWFVADANSELGEVDQDARGRADGGGARALSGSGGARHGDVGNAVRTGAWRDCGTGARSEAPGGRERRSNGDICDALEPSGSSHDLVDAVGERGCGRDGERQDAAHADASGETSWVVGFDGKRRPVKSGIRLLAHGVPNRVGLLRGFGNAIDPRPAAAFIGAFMTVSDTSQLGKSQ